MVRTSCYRLRGIPGLNVKRLDSTKIATRRSGKSSAATGKRQTLRLAYVSIESCDDVHAWSGLNYNIAVSLRSRGIEVIPIGPLASPWRSFVSKVRAAIMTALTGQRFLWTRDVRLLRYYARIAARRIKDVECDVIFSPGTEPIAYLPPSVGLPIVCWTDAPFGAMINYYPWYHRLAPLCVKEGMECDRRALGRALLAVYSSSWAADLAIERHGVCRDRVRVIPFGANLDSAASGSSVRSLVESRLTFPWRFLFVGVDWERKGADLVLAVLTELNRLGYPSQVSIVGCMPPAHALPLPDFVRIEGFIDKRTEAGRRRMSDLYRATTFFLMPSRAEAYGVVFCEACAHGVPSVTTATGGIPTIIRDGYNGRLLPLDASIADYANAILAAAEPKVYSQLCSDAVLAYEEELNWEVSSRRLIAQIEGALQREGGGG